ncbi:hypothetical protein BDFB_005620 [Asbolus verrucosus]|uniref:Uncharacterized protein n=1 Tax=Asbolus verrucosus TaxID=1661398 RepID=A0A482W3I5_ASBVE|nr:hypothetical protein BDFB_005620 [Asbolus verrucosus]
MRTTSQTFGASPTDDSTPRPSPLAVRNRFSTTRFMATQWRIRSFGLMSHRPHFVLASHRCSQKATAGMVPRKDTVG